MRSKLMKFKIGLWNPNKINKTNFFVTYISCVIHNYALFK